jgi:hypothetical protein
MQGSPRGSMIPWKKVILEKDGFPIKVYVNCDDSRCAIFPLFGKYHTVTSDKSALDLCIHLIFHVYKETSPVAGMTTYAQYISSKEDTAFILQEAA